VIPEQRVLLEPKAIPEQRVLLEPKAISEQRVLLEPKAISEQLVKPEPPVRKGHKDLLVFKVQPVPKVKRVFREFKD
jgi:hypothetical protein